MAKTKENIIHIGVDHQSAVSAKKDILLSEKGLLEIIKRMRAYSELRKQEFILKNRIKKAITEIKTQTAKIEDELPTAGEMHIPKDMQIKTDQEDQEPGIDTDEFIKKAQISKIEQKRKAAERAEKNRKIEDELEDIGAQLDRLK